MKILSNEKLELIKQGDITALVEVIYPQPTFSSMCMFKNDLLWVKDYCASTISNKPNVPDNFYKNASYGQAGDYFHIKGVTMLITDVIVRNFDNLTGNQRAAALGYKSYDEWFSKDWYTDHECLNCNEKDFVFYYTIEYIDTPPMEDMIKLANACKTIASF